MQAIKAIYDGFAFTPTQPVPVQGHYDVVITFIEPITNKTDEVCETLNENTDLIAEYLKIIIERLNEICDKIGHVLRQDSNQD